MIKNILKAIASFQVKYPYVLLAILLVLTAALATGLPKLEVQSDFAKENPRHLPAYVITDRISDEFGGEQTVVLILEVDENDENEMLDLRDPKVVSFLQEFEESLQKDSRVISTSSFATPLGETSLDSREDIFYYLERIPQLNGLFSQNYRTTILTITTNIGGAYEDVVPFEEMLYNKMQTVGAPGGVEITVTGEPSFGRVIRETVFSDTAKTMSIAAIGIFLLLLLTERSFIKSIIVFTPLLFALIWTGGALGYSGMKLSIASVALGSIILGLGVEYGVFMLTRFTEERFGNKHSQLESLQNTVSNIGIALLSSGTTTIAGFLALTFSMTPMMQVLGISLAAGIFASICAAILVTPLLLVLQENYEKWYLNNKLNGLIEKKRFYKRESKEA